MRWHGLRLHRPAASYSIGLPGHEPGVDRGAGRADTKLPSDLSAIPAARRFASQAVSDLGGDSELLDTTRLLVTELATNAVVHARSPVWLSVLPGRGRIRIEVGDDDPHPPPQPARRPGPDAESGRGLWLVSALAHDWGVDRNAHGKTIWFEIVGNGVHG